MLKRVDLTFPCYDRVLLVLEIPANSPKQFEGRSAQFIVIGINTEEPDVKKGGWDVGESTKAIGNRRFDFLELCPRGTNALQWT